MNAFGRVVVVLLAIVAGWMLLGAAAGYFTDSGPTGAPSTTTTRP